MAKKKIIWTKKANFELQEILKYWINRNRSKTFSIKLNKLFIENLETLSQKPFIGKKTDIENVRVRIIRDYLLFYEIKENAIIVLSIWDARRSNDSINLE